MFRPSGVQAFASAPKGTVAIAPTCWFTGWRLIARFDQRTLVTTATLSLVSGSILTDLASTAPPTLGYQRAGGFSLVMLSQTMFARAASGVSPEKSFAFTKVTPSLKPTSVGWPVHQDSGTAMPSWRAHRTETHRGGKQDDS